MALAGNNAGSVVDFLSSRGLRAQAGEKFPLYDTRKKLFEQGGLNSNLGDYRGSPEQNTALLNILQAKEKFAESPITPDNIFTVMGLNQPVAPSNTQSGTTPPNGDINASLAALAQKAMAPQIPENLQELALQDVQSKTAFPLQLEAVQAQKDQLALQNQAKKEKLIANLASRGLIFSGQKQTGLNSLDADELSKALGVDRKFALLLAQGLDTSAQKIVKEAQKGSSDAAAALGALGYVLTPDGQLIQKPSETRAEQSAELSEKRFEQQTARNEVSDARAIRAEQRSIEENNRAAAAFKIAQKKAADIASGKGTAYTATTIPADVKESLLEDINNPNYSLTYTELYNLYPEVSPSLIQSLYYFH